MLDKRLRDLMLAMVLEKIGFPLVQKELPCPVPGEFEVLIAVKSCGVCRTDLHIVDGELDCPKLPLILGHQIVGTVKALGSKVTSFHIGQRVGVPWLGGCCNLCEFCLEGKENLCDEGVFTGYQRNGGYAEFCTAKEEFVLPLFSQYEDAHMA